MIVINALFKRSLICKYQHNEQIVDFQNVQFSPNLYWFFSIFLTGKLKFAILVFGHDINNFTYLLTIKIT